MLALDRTVMTALVIGGDDLLAARRLVVGRDDARVYKRCMMAWSFKLMRNHGMEIMRAVSKTLADGTISVVPDDVAIVERANELLAIIDMKQPHGSGWTVDICDCIAWAMAEREGGKLATLNPALREHAGPLAALAD